MQKDQFSIFTIEGETSERDRKAAYRRLALKYHPDKNLLEDTTAAFQKISEAYYSDKSAAVATGCVKGGKALTPQSPEEKGQESTFPVAQSIAEEPPPSLEAIRQHSERLNSLLGEVIDELEERLRTRQKFEDFPEILEFARRHLTPSSGAQVCSLCRRVVTVEPRWHFESAHYDEFLYWLDIKAKVDVRRRRRKLAQHLRRVKARKAVTE